MFSYMFTSIIPTELGFFELGFFNSGVRLFNCSYKTIIFKRGKNLWLSYKLHKDVSIS